MPAPLPRTKLFIPPTRPALLPRLRLIQQLEEGLGRKFILVSASAGYGKTTLLSNWASITRMPVSWLSLEERDNDPPAHEGTAARSTRSPQRPASRREPTMSRSTRPAREYVR